MDLKVAKMRTADERTRVSAFRYRIYIDELRIPTLEANHTTRCLTDPLDDWSTSYVLLDDEQIVGELRVTRLADVPDPTAIIETFAMQPALEAFGPQAICKTSRFMLDAKRRHGTAIFQLMKTVYEEGWEQGVRLNYGDCSPHLLPFYEHLGFRRYAKAFDDPNYGFKIPILMLGDPDFLHWIRSPLARVAKRFGHDTQAGAWFTRAYPDYLVPPTAPFLPAREFFNLLATRLATDPRRGIRLLRGLGQHEIAQFFRKATLIKAEPGQRIVRQGEESDALFVLLSGQAEIANSASRAAVRRFHPGDFFGGSRFFGGSSRYAADVLTRQACEAAVLPGDSLLCFLAKEPAAATKVRANARPFSKHREKIRVRVSHSTYLPERPSGLLA